MHTIRSGCLQASARAPVARQVTVGAHEAAQSAIGRIKLVIPGTLFYPSSINTAATAVRIVGNPTLQSVESDHEWSLR